MLLIGLLLAGALDVEGSLKLTLDQATYPAADSGTVLEITYDVPYSSLAFVRDSAGFRAGFRVGVDLSDKAGNPQAGDVWERSVVAGTYDETLDRGSSLLGAVTLGLPASATSARVEVSDLNSERRATARFRPEDVDSDMRVRFLLNGMPNPARTYGKDDTLDVLAEPTRSRPVGSSLRFVIREGRREAFSSVRPVVDSAGRSVARLRLVLSDSSGQARFSGGEHIVEVVGTGDGEARGRAVFRLKVPFFYDEDAYRERVDELLYVASGREMAELKKLAPGEREKAWREFWNERDPSPTTQWNEREDEYFERIEYCKENFRRGDRGYKSDRARVYVTYGPPEHVDSKPFEIDSRAYETWYYYRLGLEFLFVDRSGFGEYVLESPRMWNEN